MTEKFCKRAESLRPFGIRNDSKLNEDIAGLEKEMDGKREEWFVAVDQLNQTKQAMRDVFLPIRAQNIKVKIVGLSSVGKSLAYLNGTVGSIQWYNH